MGTPSKRGKSTRKKEKMLTEVALSLGLLSTSGVPVVSQGSLRVGVISLYGGTHERGAELAKVILVGINEKGPYGGISIQSSSSHLRVWANDRRGGIALSRTYPIGTYSPFARPKMNFRLTLSAKVERGEDPVGELSFGLVWRNK
jgi:hypothetical protein